MPGRGESDWLADPNDYTFPTYLTTLVALIARSGADDGGLGRHVDGRPSRHGRRGAAEEPDRAARRQRRRARHRAGRARTHPRLLRPRPDVRDVRRDRAATFARFRRRSGGSPTRSGSTSPGPMSGNAPTAAGDSPTIRASRCRSGRPRRRRTCGVSGTRSAARRSCCAARSRISFPPPRRRRWRRAGPKPAVVEFADVGHAPMLLSAEQIDPVARFLRAEHLPSRDPWPTGTPPAAGRNRPSSLTIAARSWP